MPGEEVFVVAGAGLVVVETVKKVVETVEEMIVNSDYEYQPTTTDEIEAQNYSDMG